MKPRINKQCGVWWCSDYGYAHIGIAASGASPKEAFDGWMAKSLAHGWHYFGGTK